MGALLMSEKERRRVEVFGRVLRGEIELKKAAELLRISYRQAKRIKARYVAEGDAGLIHRSRGKPSARRISPEFREKVLKIVAAKYADFGPTLAAEYLAEDDEDGVIEVSVGTLRRWMIEEGMWSKRRRRKAHRRRRERKEHFGEMIQMDGSIHDWFEGRNEECVLMVAIDDATGEVFARFFKAETTAAAMTTFRRWTEKYGLPRSVYVDQHGIYRVDRPLTPDEIAEGEHPMTQFGRAMKSLDVRLILARSAQAKGRVERVNGTLQNRLIKAMRVNSISDMARANAFLDNGFLAKFNAKFARPAKKKRDLHRKAPSASKLDVTLATREQRSVYNDWTIRYNNRFFQIARSEWPHVGPRDRVEVVEQLDGRIRVFRGDRELACEEVSSPPILWPKKKSGRNGPTGSSQGRRPSAEHPWRKPFLKKRRRRAS